jgi:hypothetical protein
MEPSGTVQACIGIASPLHFISGSNISPSHYRSLRVPIGITVRSGGEKNDKADVSSIPFTPSFAKIDQLVQNP